jgi:hypothetical protein
MNYGAKKNTKPVNLVNDLNTNSNSSNNNDNFSFNPFN